MDEIMKKLVPLKKKKVLFVQDRVQGRKSVKTWADLHEFESSAHLLFSVIRLIENAD